jgi:hypothetical protein
VILAVSAAKTKRKELKRTRANEQLEEAMDRESGGIGMPKGFFVPGWTSARSGARPRAQGAMLAKRVGLSTNTAMLQDVSTIARICLGAEVSCRAVPGRRLTTWRPRRTR